MTARQQYRPDPGPPCRVCGYFAVNVTHDDPVTRARNLATWAFATEAMGNQDYYTWAGIEYHPFDPVRRGETPGRLAPRPTPVYRATAAEIARAQRSDEREVYQRGYQAGYGAARRRYGRELTDTATDTGPVAGVGESRRE